MSNYESWRISYQSSEAAARSAWQEMIRLHHRVNELEAQLSAIGADGVEPMHNREASAALTAPDERKAFDAANLRDYFGGPLSYRERDIAFMAWQARASLAATPVADAGNPALESDVSAALPEPAAWLATFRPKGMLSSHSIAGANFEELKRSVPSDSVFKPLYTLPADGVPTQTETLLTELAEAQRKQPLDEEAIERATGVKRGTPMFLAATGFVRATEHAHGITQEKQE